MIFAATFGLKPVAHEDSAFLEPSIQNEVDHAVSRAERWLAGNASLPGDIYELSSNDVKRVSFLAEKVFLSTNGLTRTRMAIKLVSEQRGDGWWICLTNAAPTRAAIQILKGL
jgi:hypothetical protein